MQLLCSVLCWLGTVREAAQAVASSVPCGSVSCSIGASTRELARLFDSERHAGEEEILPRARRPV